MQDHAEMSDPEIERERRREFDRRLDKLEETQEAIRSDVAAIKLGMVKGEEVSELRKRVRDLEDFKLRTVAALIAIQSFLAVLWMIFEGFIKLTR